LAETDIRTGKPKELLKEQRKEALANKAIQSGHAMQQALASEDGRALIDLIQGRLTDRINVLIQEDVECRTYVKLLESCQVIIDQGKAASQKKMEEALRR
jgi:hypothetical protein